MSYATILSRQQEILQGLTLLGTPNVTRGDRRVMDRGLPAFAILWPGTVNYSAGSYMPGIEFGDPSPEIKQELEWVTEVRFYSKFTTDDESEDNFNTLRQAIVDIIMGSPSLTSDTLSTLSEVKWARFGGTVDPAVEYYETDANGKITGPHWITEAISWIACEWVTVTAGQYA